MYLLNHGHAGVDGNSHSTGCVVNVMRDVLLKERKRSSQCLLKLVLDVYIT